MNGRFVQRAAFPREAEPGPTNGICGVPADAEYFDDSSIIGMPPRGQEVLLARFELPAQYCGLFQNFSQFVGDDAGWLMTTIETKGLKWLVLVNNRPLFPYIKLEHIANPWGYGSFPVSIRLDENATLEFVVRNESYAPVRPQAVITTVGGRIAGRYWYNPAYGDVAMRNGAFR